ncbi:MAG: multiheme c-type cytochrome [Mucilaginibacter sp.]
MKKLSSVITGICAILACLVYLQCQTGKPTTDPRGEFYAGSASCVKCHSNLYNSYLHTAHYIASMPASSNTVHGSFNKATDTVNLSPTQKIIMEKRDSGLYQSYYLNGKLQESHRFDIVLGAVKGESYLFWKGNGLNQLLISYYTKEHKWLLSPGYAPGQVDFARVITKRCLECHASYINDQDVETQRAFSNEQFNKSSLVYSVDCERCHGPGAQHVDFQTNNPQVKTARYIRTYASLSRLQRIDMCGQCHSGNKSQMIRSIFFFTPGDTLAKFKMEDFYSPAVNNDHIDVHGNQVQLLQGSKCYINSKMDCATCHDTHQNQRGNFALYTQKCLACHRTVDHTYCKMANSLNAELIRSNCIQCHMPSFTTHAILTANTNRTPNANITVHTHQIGIYPEEAQKILAMVGK